MCPHTIEYTSFVSVRKQLCVHRGISVALVEHGSVFCKSKSGKDWLDQWNEMSNDELTQHSRGGSWSSTHAAQKEWHRSKLLPQLHRQAYSEIHWLSHCWAEKWTGIDGGNTELGLCTHLNSWAPGVLKMAVFPEFLKVTQFRWMRECQHRVVNVPDHHYATLVLLHAERACTRTNTAATAMPSILLWDWTLSMLAPLRSWKIKHQSVIEAYTWFR